MAQGLMDKVYIGLDTAPAAFDIKSRILGPNGTNLEYIRSETGAVAVLKGDKFEPLHLALHHARSESIAAAKSLALNLIETIKAELVQWTAAQTNGPTPSMNVPPPGITSSAPAIPPTPPTPVTLSTPTLTSTSQAPVMPPVVSVPASAPLMTVRQPTVLQLLPPQQQQYVLNQENGQLIPIVQPGMQVGNQLSSLPLAHQLGAIQQHNFGTQFVDISNMQTMNVTPLRISGVPSSMSMILPNGLTIPQANINPSDSTTVSTATSTPVVCAAQGTNSSQKLLYSTDKVGDKIIQGADVQWTVPGTQTMLIPYQQFQDLANNQAGLTNIQPQQFVSIAPVGGFQQTLPLTAAQLQHLQATGTIMHINQKGGQKLVHDQRGQKRLADGTQSQLQLRPIAPAGSQVSQEKGGSRDNRSWSSNTVRENTIVSMGTKINPSHGTIIHVSSGQQTSIPASGTSQDGSGMYIKQIERNIQIQATKDGTKDLTTNKIQTATQNVQMITVPPGMVLQNPLNLGQVPVFSQQNNQVYMIPTNQQNFVQNALQPGLLGQQVLQPGQNVTVMQPNHLGVPNSVQYSVPIMPMNVQANAQYVPGLNLTAQQLGLTQQLTNQNLAVSGSIPIMQAPTANAIANQSITVSQAQQVQQIMPQNSFITPTSQYSNLPPQYVVQPNLQAASNTVQYNIQPTQPPPQQTTPNTTQANTTETEPSNNTTNQNNYITTQENGFSIQNQTQNTNQTNYNQETATQNTTYTPPSQTNTQNYANQSQNSNYSVSNQVATTQNSYNPSQTQNAQSYTANNAQTYSPSSTPAPANYNNVPYAQNSNPYPNATGQMAYGNSQYQYNMQAPSRPWFRPRYASPQGSPYNGSVPNSPMPVPPPSGNYNYWQDS